MKLLLCKNVDKLGIVGDIVNVSAGFARNYLVPQGLATEPTRANMKRLAKARRAAELERIRQREVLQALAERLNGVEITVRARANQEGVLYGSVGKREIAVALREEGYAVLPDHVNLEAPIRHLDNVPVDIRVGPDLHSTVKVWVVREKTEAGDEDVSEEPEAGREVGSDDDDDGADVD